MLVGRCPLMGPAPEEFMETFEDVSGTESATSGIRHIHRTCRREETGKQQEGM